MKILYALKITEETGFTASDFPDRFEILREGKTPLVFKPVAIRMQTIYSKLQEAEKLLKRAQGDNGWSVKSDKQIDPLLQKDIDEYFDRYSQ